jgi:hypothetical protein
LNGLRAVTEATGLHIVAATGVHRDVHYAADNTLRSESEDKLANRFVGDLERCGIIKIGAGYHTMTPFEAKGSLPQRRHTGVSVPPGACTPGTGRWGSRSSSGCESSACPPSA